MSGTQRRRPTAQDVAAMSGVSRATVSYVLNRTPGQTIPDATRHRVLEAADRLGYVPSAAAQALARGTTNVVIIDVSDLPGGVLMARATRELAESFAALDYTPVVNQYTPFMDGRSALLTLAQSIVPVAVVALNSLPDAVRDRLTNLGVPRVYSLLPEDEGLYGRGSDQTVAQMDHLHAAGHRRILYAGTAELNLHELNESRQRAALEHGARLGMAVETCSLTAGSLTDVISAGVNAGITAVAAYNDEVAIAVMGAAARAGIAVPDQLAVMGIDDIPLASVVHPRLTSVTLGPDESSDMPTLAARVLSGEKIVPYRTSPRVVARESA